MKPRFVKATNIPIGGRGASAKCSQIFFIKSTCGIKLNGKRPSGTAYWLAEQVTRIEINDAVATRKYFHDKSFGAQDVTPGGNSYDGTIATKVQCRKQAFSFRSGQVVWLQVYPLGPEKGNTVEGYAVIERAPIVCNIENGQDPVEHNYTYASKGRWRIPAGLTGTFACDCAQLASASSTGFSDSCSGAGATSLAIPADVEENMPAQTPVTVYKWDGKAWAIGYDEIRQGFVHGPAPADEPKDAVDNMRIVECQIAG